MPKAVARPSGPTLLDDPRRLAVVLPGQVLVMGPPLDFAATLPELGHGLFRYGYEAMAGHPEAILWLSTWGRPASEARAIEARWSDAFARALA